MVIALVALTVVAGCDNPFAPDVDVVNSSGVHYGFTIEEVDFSGEVGNYLTVTNRRGEWIKVRMWLVTDDEDIPKTGRFQVDAWKSRKVTVDFFPGDRIYIEIWTQGGVYYEVLIDLH